MDKDGSSKQKWVGSETRKNLIAPTHSVVKSVPVRLIRWIRVKPLYYFTTDWNNGELKRLANWLSLDE
jgi:hypothetical protein